MSLGLDFRLNKLKFLCLILGFVIGISFVFKDRVLLHQYQHFPERVGLEFWRALKDNNLFIAKGLTLPEHWNWIEQWNLTHQRTECSFWSEEVGPTVISSVQNETWQGGVNIACPTYTGEVYCFAISDIIVKQQEHNPELWIVVKWEHISEDCFE